jgi:tetratricopeptide (TPR) repeat protein
MGKYGFVSAGAFVALALTLTVPAFSAGPELNSGRVIDAAQSARDSGDLARAGEIYVSAIHNLENAGATGALPSMILGLAGVRTMQGRCMDAAGLASRGIGILESSAKSDPHARSAAWATLGRADHCQGQYSKAEMAYRRAIEIEQGSPDPRPDRLIEFMSSQGVVQEAEHKYVDAHNVFTRAQAVLNQHPQLDSNEGALLQNNFGLLLRLMGKTAESEAAFRRGLELVDRAVAPDRGLQAYLDYNLASVEMSRKQFREAAQIFSHAVWMVDSGAAVTAHTAGEMLRDYAVCERKLGDRRQARLLEARAAAVLHAEGDGSKGQVVDVAELSQSKSQSR